VTVRVDAVEQLVPVHVDALVVVTDRRNGPPWAALERTATARIAMRKRISTSVGNKKRSVEPDNVTRLRLVQSGVSRRVYSPSPPSL
jgi:hypothetical protein